MAFILEADPTSRVSVQVVLYLLCASCLVYNRYPSRMGIYLRARLMVLKLLMGVTHFRLFCCDALYCMYQSVYA